MKKMLDMYQMLNDEQKNKIFTAEERKVIEAQIFYERMFSDPAFYKAVEMEVCKMFYEEVNA